MGVGDLKQIFPDAEEGFLAETLARHGGDDQRAAEFLLANPPPLSTTAPQRRVNEHHVAGAAERNTDNYFFGGRATPVTTAPASIVYARGGGDVGIAKHASDGGGGVNAAAQRRIAEILPHEKKVDIDAALRRHNGGLTPEDEEAALNFLLNNSTGRGGGGGGGASDVGVERAAHAAAGAPITTTTATTTKTTATATANSASGISASHTVFTTAPPEPAVGLPVAPPPRASNASAAASAANPAARPPPNLPPTRALSVNAPPPRLSGRRKALLIGINYVGTSAELKGCHNDVASLHGLLTMKYGWPRDCVHALTDDGRRGVAGHPTRDNIINAMRWLTQDAAPGDVLFFAFSGHGAQQEDPRGVEEDGMNETILPVDWRTSGMITDDEIGELLVHTLPDGVRLTALMDSCHSGTGLDLPFSWQPRAGGAGAWREETNPYHSLGDVQLISGCEDDDVSCDAAGWGHRYGAPGGAMTTAFCEVLRAHSAPSYPVLLEEMRRRLRARGMAQRPQLSSSQILHFDRPFLVDDICSNSKASSSSKDARIPFPSPTPVLTSTPGFLSPSPAVGQ